MAGDREQAVEGFSVKKLKIDAIQTRTGGSVNIGDATDFLINATTGTKIGTGTTAKIGFWGATPVAQQILATGTGKTVDNVITFLQTLGLCKQS